MNQTNTVGSTPSATANGSNEGITVPRVDRAHQPIRPPDGEGDARLKRAAAGQDPESLMEQIHAQAADLQAQLEKQKRALDRRESRMNVQMAELDHERRAVRLWAREQQAELARRERDLRQPREELEQEISRLRAALAAAEAGLSTVADAGSRPADDGDQVRDELARQSAALDSRREALDHERVELDRRRAEFSVRSEHLEAEHRRAMERVAAERQQVQNRHREVLETADRLERNAERHERHEGPERRPASEPAGAHRPDPALERRTREIERLERTLADQFAEFDRERRELELERQRQSERTRAQRRSLAERFRRRQQRLRAEAEQIGGRFAALDRERDVLDQLHREVGDMHHQTLEMRLVAEQLWMELGGRSHPAHMTRRIGEIRRQLADQFRFARESLDEQKTQIERLCERLGAQRLSLEQRRADLEQWFARRQDEIEEQAARLVAREQQLDAQERYYKELKQKWDQQRREQQQAIRRLTVDLQQARLGIEAA